jgi:hypothetical protein
MRNLFHGEGILSLRRNGGAPSHRDSKNTARFPRGNNDALPLGGVEALDDFVTPGPLGNAWQAFLSRLRGPWV